MVNLPYSNEQEAMFEAVKKQTLKGQSTKKDYGMQNVTKPLTSTPMTNQTMKLSNPMDKHNNPVTRMNDNIGKDKNKRILSSNYGISKSSVERNKEIGIDSFGRGPVGNFTSKLGSFSNFLPLIKLFFFCNSSLNCAGP